ncbi:MAG: hypothetical protein QW231_06540 [Candidatus Bathyarchaeia archaeon]
MEIRLRIPVRRCLKVKVRLKLRGLRYLRENPGAPFIMGFQGLLLGCAFQIVQGNEALANALAVYAYYLLALGITLQTIAYLRLKGSASKAEEGG